MNAQFMKKLSYITFYSLSLAVQIQQTTTIQNRIDISFVSQNKFLFEFLDDIIMAFNFYAIVLEVVKSNGKCLQHNV